MANTPKLLSGRVAVRPYNDLTSDRYDFLGLDQAEPSLGAGAANSVLTLSTGNQRVWSNSLSLTSISVTGNVAVNAISTSNLTITTQLTTSTGSNSVFSGNVDLANVPSLNLGNTSHLKLSGGTVGYVLGTDGLGNVAWQPVVATPAGSNTQVQYNNGGLLGGSPKFTFNNLTDTLTIAGHLVANTFQMGSGVYKFFSSEVLLSSTSSITPDQVLYTIPASQVSSIDFVIISTDSLDVTRTSTKISATVLGSEVAYTEYAGIHINGGVGSFSVDYIPGDVINPPLIRLLCSPDSSHYTTHNILITKYASL